MYHADLDHGVWSKSPGQVRTIEYNNTIAQVSEALGTNFDSPPMLLLFIVT